MNCDFLVLLLLGFSGRDSNRDGAGEHVSEILKRIGNVCNLPSDGDSLPLPNQPQKHVDSSEENDDNRLELLGQRIPVGQDSSRRNVVAVNPFSHMPVVTGMVDLNEIVNNNAMSNTVVQVPASVVMKLIPRDKLSVLYQDNQIFDVPVEDPSAPKLIAMTGRILSSIIRGKKRLHNVIDHGVAGAENLFSGIHEAVGGVAEFIGGGAHGLLDLIG